MYKPQAQGALIFAPGVQLFRQLRFRAKAILISTAFVIPTLILGASYLQSKFEVIDATRAELVGVQYANEIVPLFKAARQVRRYTMVEVAGSPAPELADVRSKLDAQLAKVKDTDTRIGEGLGAHEAYATVLKLQQTAAPASAGLFKVFATHSKFSGAVTALMSKVADASGLTLDPELDTYFLQNAAFATLPALLETTAKMRVLAAAIARTGKDGELAANELAQEEGVLEYLNEIIKNDLGKVVEVHPELKADLDLSVALKSIAKLRDLAGDTPASAGADGAKKIEDMGGEITNQLEKIQATAIKELQRLLEKRISLIQAGITGISVLVCLFLLGAGYMFISFIIVVDGGLQSVRQHLKIMASGDLTAVLRPVGRDETAQLKESLQQMQQSLVSLVSLLNSSADHLASSSNQVATGAQDLSARTEETVQSLQGTASAITEISSTVESSADNAQQATRLAKENAELATRGGKVIADMVHTMEEIRESSSKIGDIISVIDGIAFQTNILALNAAVEAARAGEAGRGFAVVATEVRALAQRSASAAREITALITTSVEKVNSGNVTVKSAGTTIESVVVSAKRISDLLDDISVGTREQAIGVKQVEQTVQELDMAARENARLVEETSNAAEALQHLASELVNEVAGFKLPKQDVDFF